MSEFVVLILRQAQDAAGRTAGVCVTAVAVSSGAVAGRSTPVVTATPLFSTDLADNDSAVFILPSAAPGSGGFVSQIDNQAAFSSLQAIAPYLAALPAPALPAARPMPGWLAARTQQQALLASRTSRPVHRTDTRRPRPGNRPTRAVAAPRTPPKPPVVWMAAR
jgi:hypothetical protein